MSRSAVVTTPESTPAVRRRSTLRIAVFTVLVAAGAGFLVAAWRLPAGSATQPDFGLFPRIAGLLLVVSAVVALLSSLLGETAGDDESGAGTSYRRPVGLIVTAALYPLFAGLLGHTITLALVSAAALRIAGSRRWLVTVAVAAGIAIASYLVFGGLLDIRLPRGLVGF